MALKDKFQMTNKIKINKLQLNNFRFFIDDEANNSFDINGKNMLIYGENGSGKSSIFKAFDFLSSQEISNKEFQENINIFNPKGTFLKFEFSNNESLEIDEDHLNLDDDYPFISKLSITKPMLDYKSLLSVSYSVDKQKNLYSFFKKILENYPIDKDGRILKDLDGEEYFNQYKQIVKNEILDDINIFLDKFKQNIKITDCKFDGFNKTTFLTMDYSNETIDEYSNFLNEARLSALAISIYFAIIKKQFSLLENDALKILVLDDLLISLDMNNRLSLIDILKSEFSDFQIFFFTHDKSLFEVLKDKMDWESFEIYVEKNEDYETPFIKKSNNLLEQAKYHYVKYQYGCSANIARKYLEDILCTLIPADKLVHKDCTRLGLISVMNKGISLEKKKENPNQDIIDGIERLITYTRVILHPSSHSEDVNIYKKELKDVIDVLDILNRNIICTK